MNEVVKPLFGSGVSASKGHTFVLAAYSSLYK